MHYSLTTKISPLKYKSYTDGYSPKIMDNMNKLNFHIEYLLVVPKLGLIPYGS